MGAGASSHAQTSAEAEDNDSVLLDTSIAASQAPESSILGASAKVPAVWSAANGQKAQNAAEPTSSMPSNRLVPANLVKSAKAAPKGKCIAEAHALAAAVQLSPFAAVQQQTAGGAAPASTPTPHKMVYVIQTEAGPFTQKFQEPLLPSKSKRKAQSVQLSEAAACDTLAAAAAAHIRLLVHIQQKERQMQGTSRHCILSAQTDHNKSQAPSSEAQRGQQNRPMAAGVTAWHAAAAATSRHAVSKQACITTEGPSVENTKEEATMHMRIARGHATPPTASASSAAAAAAVSISSESRPSASEPQQANACVSTAPPTQLMHATAATAFCISAERGTKIQARGQFSAQQLAAAVLQSSQTSSWCPSPLTLEQEASPVHAAYLSPSISNTASIPKAAITMDASPSGTVQPVTASAVDKSAALPSQLADILIMPAVGKGQSSADANVVDIAITAEEPVRRTCAQAALKMEVTCAQSTPVYVSNCSAMTPYMLAAVEVEQRHLQGPDGLPCHADNTNDLATGRGQAAAAEHPTTGHKVLHPAPAAGQGSPRCCIHNPAVKELAVAEAAVPQGPGPTSPSANKSKQKTESPATLQHASTSSPCPPVSSLQHTAQCFYPSNQPVKNAASTSPVEQTPNCSSSGKLKSPLKPTAPCFVPKGVAVLLNQLQQATVAAAASATPAPSPPRTPGVSDGGISSPANVPVPVRKLPGHQPPVLVPPPPPPRTPAASDVGNPGVTGPSPPASQWQTAAGQRIAALLKAGAPLASLTIQQTGTAATATATGSTAATAAARGLLTHVNAASSSSTVQPFSSSHSAMPLYQDTYSGPVCLACGDCGHSADGCSIPYCSKCSRHGHHQLWCMLACKRCGRHHPTAGDAAVEQVLACPVALCANCGLFGHITQLCPTGADNKPPVHQRPPPPPPPPPPQLLQQQQCLQQLLSDHGYALPSMDMAFYSPSTAFSGTKNVASQQQLAPSTALHAQSHTAAVQSSTAATASNSLQVGTSGALHPAGTANISLLSAALKASLDTVTAQPGSSPSAAASTRQTNCNSRKSTSCHLSGYNDNTISISSDSSCTTAWLGTQRAACAFTTMQVQPAAAAVSGPGTPLAGRKYAFLEEPVCCRCGTIGHEPAACSTPYCSTCNRFGHQKGTCGVGCSTCGRIHGMEGCPGAMCALCKMWGHVFQSCPANQCGTCKCYGHWSPACPLTRALLSLQQQSPEAVGLHDMTGSVPCGKDVDKLQALTAAMVGGVGFQHATIVQDSYEADSSMAAREQQPAGSSASVVAAVCQDSSGSSLADYFHKQHGNAITTSSNIGSLFGSYSDIDSAGWHNNSFWHIPCSWSGSAGTGLDEHGVFSAAAAAHTAAPQLLNCSHDSSTSLAAAAADAAAAFDSSSWQATAIGREVALPHSWSPWRDWDIAAGRYSGIGSPEIWQTAAGDGLGAALDFTKSTTRVQDDDASTALAAVSAAFCSSSEGGNVRLGSSTGDQHACLNNMMQQSPFGSASDTMSSLPQGSTGANGAGNNMGALTKCSSSIRARQASHRLARCITAREWLQARGCNGPATVDNIEDSSPAVCCSSMISTSLSHSLPAAVTEMAVGNATLAAANTTRNDAPTEAPSNAASVSTAAVHHSQVVALMSKLFQLNLNCYATVLLQHSQKLAYLSALPPQQLADVLALPQRSAQVQLDALYNCHVQATSQQQQLQEQRQQQPPVINGPATDYVQHSSQPSGCTFSPIAASQAVVATDTAPAVATESDGVQAILADIAEAKTTADVHVHSSVLQPVVLESSAGSLAGLPCYMLAATASALSDAVQQAAGSTTYSPSCPAVEGGESRPCSKAAAVSHNAAMAAAVTPAGQCMQTATRTHNVAAEHTAAVDGSNSTPSRAAAASFASVITAAPGALSKTAAAAVNPGLAVAGTKQQLEVNRRTTKASGTTRSAVDGCEHSKLSHEAVVLSVAAVAAAPSSAVLFGPMTTAPYRPIRAATVGKNRGKPSSKGAASPVGPVSATEADSKKISSHAAPRSFAAVAAITPTKAQQQQPARVANSSTKTAPSTLDGSNPRSPATAGLFTAGATPSPAAGKDHSSSSSWACAQPAVAAVVAAAAEPKVARSLYVNRISSKSDDADGLCVVCWECDRQVGLLHGDTVHVCLCVDCSAWDTFKVGKPCPMCRQRIEGKVELGSKW